MNLNKLMLGSTAIATLAIFAAACSSSGGGSKVHKLDSGTYAYTINSVSNNTCFAAGIPPTGIAVNFAITSTNGTTFTLVPPTAAQAFIPPIAGTKTGNALDATGNASAALTSSCTLAITATATGSMTADDEFNADITANLSAATTASNGNPSNCSALAGTTIGGAIPFPTLSNPTNGTCALTISGAAVYQGP